MQQGLAYRALPVGSFGSLPKLSIDKRNGRAEIHEGLGEIRGAHGQAAR